MAGATLLTLLDDIASVLDDVATMSKVAVEKTAGVLGDDLALNAQQVSGVDPSRELPVVWSVARGSLVNKAILVPAALLISAAFPAAVRPLLMLGGVYLCFEGVEKIVHRFLPRWLSHAEPHSEQGVNSQGAESTAVGSLASIDPLSEKSKIRGAIRTDFVLSAEIIVIAMGTFPMTTLYMRTLVLSAVALLMTFGVYGLVATIVKLDDVGFHLLRSKHQGWSGSLRRWLGTRILAFAPRLLRFLGVAGTVAMFLVGGHIIIEGIPVLHHWESEILGPVRDLRWLGSLFAWFLSGLLSIAVGLISGGIAFAVVTGLKRLWNVSSRSKNANI